MKIDNIEIPVTKEEIDKAFTSPEQFADTITMMCIRGNLPFKLVYDSDTAEFKWLYI